MADIVRCCCFCSVLMHCHRRCSLSAVCEIMGIHATIRALLDSRRSAEPLCNHHSRTARSLCQPDPYSAASAGRPHDGPRAAAHRSLRPCCRGAAGPRRTGPLSARAERLSAITRCRLSPWPWAPSGGGAEHGRGGQLARSAGLQSRRRRQTLRRDPLVSARGRVRDAGRQRAAVVWMPRGRGPILSGSHGTA